MAFALAAALAGCAHAYEPYDQAQGPEILSELPANAPPGECYAKVKVPGEPIGPPPMIMGAVWVMSPGPAGSPGAIWCLVPTGPVPAGPAPMSPERSGWIRVLCDTDAAPTRIRTVQEKLHERGYYRGEVSGRYDHATAEAVTQFQSQAHIGHGGYLSLQTIQALEQPQPGYVVQGYATAAAPICGQCSYPAPPAPPVYYQPAPNPCCQQPLYQQPVYQPPVYPQPVYQQPVYQQPAYQPPIYQQPVYAPPCCAAHQAYQGGYYAGSPTPAYASAQASASASAHAGGGRASARASASVIQNGWLTWGGKTGY